MKQIVALLAWREVNSSHRLMSLIVLMLGMLNLFFGEIIPAGGGFGWDGKMYAMLTRNLPQMISDGQLNAYYAQRILPSAIVRIMLLAVNSQMSNIAIIRGFELYNLAILMGACLTWKRISNHYELSIGGRWLGFSGLFLSYQCSKQAFYYPVLTDVTALFFGMLMLLFYSEKRPIPLLVTTIIGAFAWQVASICGALLLFFLKIDITSDNTESSHRNNSSKIYHKIYIVWLALLGSTIIIVIFLEELRTILHIDRIVFGINSLQTIITGLPSFLAVILALALLTLSNAFIVKALKSTVNIKLNIFLIASAAYAIPWCIVRLISNPILINDNSFLATAIGIVLPPRGKVLLPLVTHVVYWGPMVILLLLKWNQFCVEARKLGPGFVAVITLSLPLCLVTEPRYITLAWPFFVLGAVLVMEKFDKTKAMFFQQAFAVLTIIYSQFWLKINLAPWTGSDLEGLNEFPKSVYFMHFGPWMNWVSYSIQSVLVIISIIWLNRSLKQLVPVVRSGLSAPATD